MRYSAHMLEQKDKAKKETTPALDAIAQAFADLAVAFLDEQALERVDASTNSELSTNKIL